MSRRPVTALGRRCADGDILGNESLAATATTRRVPVNTRQKIHLLLGDVVAKKAAPTGPTDVLEQAVLALVDCIEILADAVDDVRDRLEPPPLPQLTVVSDPAPPDQLTDLRRQVKDLSKVVKKMHDVKPVTKSGKKSNKKKK
jgi:hypothetical protein